MSTTYWNDAWTLREQSCSSLKSLDSYLKTTIQSLPPNLREEAAKALDLSPDDLVSINESDYDVRLKAGLFESADENKKEESAEAQDKELKKNWSLNTMIL